LRDAAPASNIKPNPRDNLLALSAELVPINRCDNFVAILFDGESNFRAWLVLVYLFQITRTPRHSSPPQVLSQGRPGFHHRIASTVGLINFPSLSSVVSIDISKDLLRSAYCDRVVRRIHCQRFERRFIFDRTFFRDFDPGFFGRCF